MDNSGLFGKNRPFKGKEVFLFSLLLICFIFNAYAVKGKSFLKESSSDTLTVMTYNIHHGRGIDGNIDLNRISTVINQAKADIVTLQEVDIKTERSGGVDILEVLSSKTDLKHTVFGMNLEFDGGEYGNAILSRYPLENYQNHHFENISGEQRGVLTAIIDVDEKDFLIINTHLDHTEHDDSERVLYAENIRDKILPFYKDIPTVFAGDLNDVPGSKTYQIINSSLFDAWTAAGKGEGFTIPVDQPAKRIDYIFHTAHLKPLCAKVVQSEASDHLPVVVTFLYIND